MQIRGLSGTNAIAFKFRDGVIAAVDTGANYGYLSVPNVQKVFSPTKNAVLLFSGLISDIQFLIKFIKEEIESDEGRTIDPQGIHKMVQRILYQKRSEGSPLQVSVIVCGVNHKTNTLFQSTDDAGRMIGVVNSKGNFWYDDSVSLSFSSSFALPILRDIDLLSLDREQAIKLMEECFRILCYKDCRSTNRIEVAIVEKGKTEIMDPYEISTEWLIGKTEEEILLQ